MIDATLDHFSCSDYEHFYEPSDDSYLLCDSIEKDLDELRELGTGNIVEIGSGSGFVITTLAKTLGPGFTYYATDINEKACCATKQTASNNNVTINVTHTNLVDSLESNLSGKIDVLLFNPPYVPTGDDEVGRRDITAAWAGGKDGVEPLNALLPKINSLLSPKGRFYLIALRENKPASIARYLGDFKLLPKIMAKKVAVIKKLD